MSNSCHSPGMVQRLLFCLLTMLITSLSVTAQGEHYNFSKLDIYNGLSHNQVNTLLRDQKGFLWFGTVSGLNRYDGYSFKIFRNQPGDTSSLIDNYIGSLYQLPEGKIWVMTRNLPCVYDSRTEKFNANTAAYLASLGLPNGTLLNIIKGKERYWFLYDSIGLYQYDHAEKRSGLFKPTGMNGAQKITDVEEAGDGNLWLVYQDGLLQKVDTRTHRVIASSDMLKKTNKGRFTYNFFIDRSGDIWLWTANSPNGLFLFNTSSNTIRTFNETTSPRLNTNLITGVTQDGDGLIWVATDHGGINLIDKKKDFSTRFLTNDPKDLKSLGQNSVTSIYKDNNGIIWIGTYKQGVNYLNENIVRFAHYHHQESNPQSLQYDDVNRFVEDKAGNIWIGTNGGGLIYFDRATNSFRQYLHDPKDKNSLSNNVIVSLCIDHEDKLWIGTYFGGLNCFDGKKFTHYKHDETNPASLSDDRVWEIFEDNDRNLWIGTLNGGLSLMDRKAGRFEHYQYKEGKPSPLQSNYISSILQDKHGNLWIGTATGITVFEKNKTTPVHYQHSIDKNSLSNNNVISIYEDRKGRLWVGTREGLNLFDPATKTFQTFTTADGLTDNIILTIVEDDQQALWITTPNGLCNIIPKENNGNLITLSVINYDEMNDLQGREFNENAALRTRSGELIFGGPAGFNVIDPRKITRPGSHPRIVFTSLHLLNNSVEAGEMINNRVLLSQAMPEASNINLKYKENVISIEFASLDFSHSSRDKYAYKLEGFNNDWLYTDGTQRRATYTNLDPGHYVFKVKALNNIGVWSEEKTLSINVAPPFWRTPLAIIIYALVAIGILLLARRITLDRAHMRFEVKQQRREAERAYALDRLKTKFFTNVSHEFRTPLSLIISPLDKIIKNTSDADQKKQLHLVHRNAKRLLNLVNQLLDFRKMEVQEFKLHPAIGDIIKFIKDISYSFSDIAEKKSINLSFDTNIEELEIYFDKDKIEKILFNLLSNAFKYTHDNGNVRVNLVYQPPQANENPGSLAIEVSDTGIGIPADKHDRIFERFFQNDVPESMVNQGSGIGLAITKEFVKLHHGTIAVKSEPEKGTSFTVSIPAKKIYDPAASSLADPAAAIDEELLVLHENGTNGRKKTILVVEDNEDLRFYLKDNLKTLYHVEEAINGKEAWEKVKKLGPELVVSDIMMPQMNGIELARKIKSDTNTAHIPVILLTAMGNEDMQLEGYGIGVSDYITKPFTFEILASRIRNLLAQQKLLQKKFQKQIEVNPGEITVTPLDEQFIRQALDAVEKNMGNPEFSVEEFSRDMCMSRVALYKKTLALTGKAPLEFIRSLRLKRAAQLLEKSGMSVSEIAYEVGFNNPKNFSKYFKEEFKVVPSQYQAEKSR